MDEATLSKMRELDWREIAAKLLVSAISLAARYGWRQDSALPNGQSLIGVAQEAIAEIWENPDRINSDVSLGVQLKGIVRQKLWNLSQCADGKQIRSDDLSTVEDTRGSGIDSSSECQRVLDILLDSPKVKGNEDRELVVMAMMEGAFSPADIATKTGLTQTRVYQINRELREIYPSIADQLRREDR